MNGWVDDDDDDVEEEEDEENKDADIEEDDDAEIIFPYEVQGDQTSLPRDESSDSDSDSEAEEADDEPEVEEADDELEVEEAGVEPEAEGANVELEAEEPDGVPEATIGTGSQRLFVALRRDLEALRRQKRIREAESETSRTEVALLGSEAKIGKMEREILHHDLSGVEETLGNADGTSVRGAGPTVPELTGKWMTKEFYPRSVIQRMEQELYNLRMKGMDIDGMVEPEAVKVEQYIRGLTKSIRGDVTSSQPATINDAVRLAYQFAGQLIQDKADEATEGEKRKGEGDQGSRGDNRREHNRHQNQRRGNAGAMTNAAPNNNETCQKCKNKRHAEDCWKKRDCPKLGRNGQGGNNRGGVYQLGAVNAQEDPKVVTDTFLLNNHYATALFNLGVDRSFVSTKFSALINIKPVEIDTSYEVELADG
nr:hypothetical protein [Tanacetum cinerariifolium]